MPPSGTVSGSAFSASSEPPSRSGASHSSQASDSAISAISAALAAARSLATPELPPRTTRFHLHAHVELRRAAELRLQLVDCLLHGRGVCAAEADQLAAAVTGDGAAFGHLGERELALAAALRAGDLHVHAKRSA